MRDILLLEIIIRLALIVLSGMRLQKRGIAFYKIVKWKKQIWEMQVTKMQEQYQI